MYYIQYIIARFFIFLLLLFPERLRFKFGDFLGMIAYKLIKSRRLTALINLRMAFPEKSEEEILKDFFAIFSISSSDFSGKAILKFIRAVSLLLLINL